MIKDDILPINDDVKVIYLGLGWESKCDLDAGMVFFDKKGEKINQCFWKDKYKELKNKKGERYAFLNKDC